jgi:hypothetical protein
MNFRLYFLTIILGLLVLMANAQTKIGNNPTIINPGAVLELESKDKGLLLPRVELTNATTWTLEGDKPEHGMIVYNVGRNLPVGLYYWDNTPPQGKWLRILNASEFPGVSTGTGAPTALLPLSPNAGDIYVDESIGDLYTYDGTTNTWVNQTVGTVTTLIKTDGTFTYTSEDGTITTFDADGDLLDNTDGTFTYTNAAGLAVTCDAKGTMVDNSNGTYTFTDAGNTITTIDVIALEPGGLPAPVPTWVRLIEANDADLRLVGTNNHITSDAGVGSNGTSVGTGTNNIAIGSATGGAITTAIRNVFIDSNSGKSIISGNQNVFIGASSGENSSLGRWNVAIGDGAFKTATGGQANLALGYLAMGSASSTINQNVAIGAQSCNSSIQSCYSRLLC